MTSTSRALVTGASAGIGQSFATHLARSGHALVLVARRADRLDEVAATLRKQHGVDVEVLPADLSTREGMEAVAARIAADPMVDMLVNNAGYAVRSRVAELDFDAFEDMLRVNLLALSRLSSVAMKRMIAAGRGVIINVASGSTFMQGPTNAGYGASKNFVTYFTRTMQTEAEGTGVQIQLLIPGVVATDFHALLGGQALLPPERIMCADDLVSASLRALEMEEPVCIPSLPQIADWDAFVAAGRKVALNVSRDTSAERYR